MSGILEDLKAKITAIHNDCNIGEGITEKVVSTVAEVVSVLLDDVAKDEASLRAQIDELKAKFEAGTVEGNPGDDVVVEEKEAKTSDTAATGEVPADEGAAEAETAEDGGTVEGNPGESPAVDGEKSETVTEAEGAVAG